MKTWIATVCVCWCTLMLMLLLTPSLAIEEQQQPQFESELTAFRTVTFELKNGFRSYSKFLTRLRNAITSNVRSCGLKTTPSKQPRGQGYVYVKLQTGKKKWVTLAVEVTNLYVWGYEDSKKYNGKTRANYFSDTPQYIKESVFINSEVRTASFASDYSSLEKAAGVKREDLMLGIASLDEAITSVYNVTTDELNDNVKKEAKFLLIAIQMVAEAARFRLMENSIVAGDNSEDLKLKTVSFQDEWEKISNAIHNAAPECKEFSPPLQVGDDVYNNVDEIKDEIGILKYKSTNYILNDDNNDGLAFLESVLM
ncbi:ribosome-inactivating protein PD-L3/PD-L4-like [Amaranthus tricolor]|uniref:ribosome-inactivating protein PD-L3/PD-L4-like n=1 Tax=Amaranthus tricolor TaxID=29722 RepID=UPI0025860105|nr:ribosome-inactivating protein PD-L3/PD-L4-like [Amaranthus tricolor]